MRNQLLICVMLSIPDPHGPNSVRPPYDEMFSKQQPSTPRTAQKGVFPGWAKPQQTSFSLNQQALNNYFGMSNRWVAVANTRYKLVFSANENPWLFDLEKDPDERTNCYADPRYGPIIERLGSELIRQMREYDFPGAELMRTGDTVKQPNKVIQ